MACGRDLAKQVGRKHGVIPKGLADAIPDWQHEGDEQRDDPALVAQDWFNIRSTMWNYVGISRSEPRLRRAFEDMRDLVRHIHDFYKTTRISRRLVDLFHGSQTAYVITRSSKNKYAEVYRQMDQYVPAGHTAAVSLRSGDVGSAFWQEEFLRQVRELLAEKLAAYARPFVKSTGEERSHAGKSEGHCPAL